MALASNWIISDLEENGVSLCDFDQGEPKFE